ncbi:Magnesium transport protein CorA [Hartmannibacter diazotrophicus]|uniref:Magnesium transport protein CorA n=1 Tax=Hartmannibacter diazotrophicus TaxID=1482074 RepID=A0A2C9D349_9HYPH|nr:magnesium transporter CorA family protein [Hartmannibacter diazotrophicus]SON54757.1 Magnesium transport protein CorA [Hartmannibacter diazotrophicus]
MIDLFRPGNGHLLREPDCGNDRLHDDIVWIDLSNPTREEDAAVSRFIGADLITREEMEEIEPSSRLSIEDGVLYLTALLLCRSESSSPDTTEVTFILTPRHLVTVRYDEPGTMPMARSRVGKPGAGVTTAGGALIFLLDVAIDRIADVLERTGARIEKLARRIFESGVAGRAHQDILSQIGREGMRIGHIQESLTSLSRMLLFLLEKADSLSFPKTDKARLKTLARDAQALAEHARGLEDRVTFLLDATLGFVSIEQNATIKIFSVLAVVFMPPTLIASIYGMNFRLMPELDWAYGYPMALGLMLLSAVGTFVLFRWRKWL